VGGYVIILIAVFALMWLLLIRPQRRKQLEQARMQDAIEVGDES
jgi:preprotein translocase subunit YajC